MNCTKIRHLAVTMTSALLPDECGNLAQLMCHSVAEQQKTYNECLKSCMSVRASNILFKLLTEQDLSEADMEKAHYGTSTFTCMFK